MKSLVVLFSIFCCLQLSVASAQLEKGNWLVDGNFQVSNENQFNDDFQLVFSPLVGYFVKEQLVFGAGVLYDWKSIDNFSSSANTFGGSVFARNYLGKNKFNPYLQLTGYLNRINFAYNNLSETQTGLIGQIGANYFLSPNVAINPSININIVEGERFVFPATDFIVTPRKRVFLRVGVQFFLRNKLKHLVEQEKKKLRLTKRFFQKGNQTIGFNGNIQFDNFLLRSNISWKKFISKQTRFNWVAESFLGSEIFGDKFGGILVIRPELEHFMEINKPLYFSPSLGINTLFSSISDEQVFRFNVRGHLKFTYFFSNLLLDAGILIDTPYIGNDTEEKMESSLVIAAAYFIQNNLSIRGEFRQDMTGPEHLGDFFLFDRPPSTTFRIGFNYFFGKEKEKD